MYLPSFLCICFHLILTQRDTNENAKVRVLQDIGQGLKEDIPEFVVESRYVITMLISEQNLILPQGHVHTVPLAVWEQLVIISVSLAGKDLL